MSDTYKLYQAGQRVIATLGEHRFTGKVVSTQRKPGAAVLVSFGNGAIAVDPRSLQRISRNGVEYVR